jgi:hypothetical protein
MLLLLKAKIMEQPFFVNRRSGSKYNTQQRIFLKSSQKPISNIYGTEDNNTGERVVENVLKKRESEFAAPCSCGYELVGSKYQEPRLEYCEKKVIAWIQKRILGFDATDYYARHNNTEEYDEHIFFDEYKSQVEHLKYGLEDSSQKPNLEKFKEKTKEAREKLNWCQYLVTYFFFLPVLFGVIEVQGLITMFLYIQGYFELASFSLYVQLLSMCTIQFFKTCIFRPRPFVPIENYYLSKTHVLPVSFVTILICIQQSILIL